MIFVLPPPVCCIRARMTHLAFILITYSGCNVPPLQNNNNKLKNTIYLVTIYLFLNFFPPLIKNFNGKNYN